MKPRLQILIFLLQSLRLMLWWTVARYFRPLWRLAVQLDVVVFKFLLRKFPSSRRYKNSVESGELLLFFERKAAWQEFLPLLQNRQPGTGMQLCETLFYLYWVNGRFREAAEACEYWQSTAQAWLQEHKSEGQQALKLLRKKGTWKPGYRQQDKAWNDEATALEKQARKLGGAWVRNYRNAKFAKLVLQWLEERDYTPAHSYLSSHKLDKNPPFPMPRRFEKYFGYETMQSLGMDDNTFFNLCRKAEPDGAPHES